MIAASNPGNVDLAAGGLGSSACENCSAAAIRLDAQCDVTTTIVERNVRPCGQHSTCHQFSIETGAVAAAHVFDVPGAVLGDNPRMASGNFGIVDVQFAGGISPNGERAAKALGSVSPGSCQLIGCSGVLRS